MHKLQRRHLNYLQRHINFRSYSLVSIKYVSGNATRDPAKTWRLKWDHTFDTPYSEDTVLFIIPYFLGIPLETDYTKVAHLVVTSQSTTGFTSLAAPWWYQYLQAYPGGESVPAQLDSKQVNLAFSVIQPPDISYETFAIIFEIDPESVFV